MSGKKKIIYVDWKDWERGQTFLVSQDTEVRIKRASIPLVFVPGIMGSRLKHANGETAWNPDSLRFMLGTFFSATGSERKRVLIDQPCEVITTAGGGRVVEQFRQSRINDFTINTSIGPIAAPPSWDWLPIPADMPAQARLEKAVDVLMAQGWEQVAWAFYGGILLKLAETKFGELSRTFMHPVYACGYNWIEDNRKGGTYLAEQISKIVDREVGLGRECEKVILISHSMGGLVTRASVILPGKTTKVLGIVHGAQPATGAPAAYRRMRAGFENTSWGPKAFAETQVMGADNSRVVPILANCIGGLELLPNQLYTNNKKEKAWLKLVTKDHVIAEALPKSDVYNEIYRGEDFLRLINHPELLTPGTTLASPRSRLPNSQSPALKNFLLNLGKAESFHADLTQLIHKNTYVAYVGHDGPGTFDEIRYRHDQNQSSTDVISDGAGGVVEFPREEGSGTDLDRDPPGGGAAQYFTIDNPDGQGDGTVPVSSSSSLIAGSANHTVTDDKGKLISANIKAAEHSDFFNHADAQAFTISSIRQLQFIYRFDKIQR